MTCIRGLRLQRVSGADVGCRSVVRSSLLCDFQQFCCCVALNELCASGNRCLQAAGSLVSSTCVGRVVIVMHGSCVFRAETRYDNLLLILDFLAFHVPCRIFNCL